MADQVEARGRLATAALALFGHEPRRLRELEVLGRRLAQAISREKPYTGYYVRNLLWGNQPTTAAIVQATQRLLLSLEQRRMVPSSRTFVQAEITEGQKVEANVLILADSVACICGVHFIPRTPNQRYHTRLCSLMARRSAKHG